jgi:hypothetical protein
MALLEAKAHRKKYYILYAKKPISIKRSLLL